MGIRNSCRQIWVGCHNLASKCLFMIRGRTGACGSPDNCCKHLGRAPVVELPDVFSDVTAHCGEAHGAGAGLPTPPKRATAGLPYRVPLPSRSDAGGVGRPAPRQDLVAGLPTPPKRRPAGLPYRVPLPSRSDAGGVGRPAPSAKIFSRVSRPRRNARPQVSPIAFLCHRGPMRAGSGDPRRRRCSTNCETRFRTAAPPTDASGSIPEQGRRYVKTRARHIVAFGARRHRCRRWKWSSGELFTPGERIVHGHSEY